MYNTHSYDLFGIQIDIPHTVNYSLPTDSFVYTRSVIIVLTSIGELISPNRSVSLL